MSARHSQYHWFLKMIRRVRQLSGKEMTYAQAAARLRLTTKEVKRIAIAFNMVFRTVKKKRRSERLDMVKACATNGLCFRDTALYCGMTKQGLWQLASRHHITFKPTPPHPKEHFQKMGRKSAESPKHHHFTDKERAESLKTRRGEQPKRYVERMSHD